MNINKLGSALLTLIWIGVACAVDAPLELGFPPQADMAGQLPTPKVLQDQSPPDIIAPGCAVVADHSTCAHQGSPPLPQRGRDAARAQDSPTPRPSSLREGMP